MTRDERILSLRKVVVAIAVTVQGTYGGDLDELIGDGWVGAIQAVDRYDPQNEAGASLATFAKHRIRGSILDGLRARDFVPVNQHRKAAAGEIQLPAQPDSMEREIEPGLRLSDALIDPASTGAVDLLLDQLDVRAGVALLPSRQAHVIRERFWRGRSLLSIAAELHVSEARVCQLTKEAKTLLANGLSMATS